MHLNWIKLTLAILISLIHLIIFILWVLFLMSRVHEHREMRLLRPVSTQKNKHQIGLDFFPSCIIHTAGQKILENTSTLYHPGCGSHVQTGTENWYRKPMRGFNFVPIRSDPMLIFLSGNRPLSRFSTWRICSREQAKSQCDWLVMSSVFVASQSGCFFLCSREQIRQVENRL